MSTGEAAHAVVLESFVENGIGLTDLCVENGAEGGHGGFCFYSSAAEWQCEW
jgi:hypothetical protein